MQGIHLPGMELLTTGGEGAVLGAAVPLPAALVQPFTVVVTVYIPPVLTVILEVVAPVLHNREPVAAVDKLDVPSQLFVTFTTGVVGIILTVTTTLWLFVHPVAVIVSVTV